jgi:hypothetical protein
LVRRAKPNSFRQVRGGSWESAVHCIAANLQGRRTADLQQRSVMPAFVMG